MSSRFVTIGLPVYNGGDDLKRALDSILTQTHTHFELIISDNASTDDVTQQLTEEYARRDPRIKLTRQPVNCGAVKNFMWVLEQAKGDYFMWAAHDDTWSNNYVEVLANRLDSEPEASLATPMTLVTQRAKSGEIKCHTIPPAPNRDRWRAMNIFVENICSTWVYGLYRREWVANSVLEWKDYPLLYGDVIWLFGMLLHRTVVGDTHAILHYAQPCGKYKDLTSRRKIELWGLIGYHATRLSWKRLPASERARGLFYAFKFFYLHQLCRRNPIGTTVRVIKLSLIWSWIGLETGIRRLVRVLHPLPH